MLMFAAALLHATLPRYVFLRCRCFICCRFIYAYFDAAMNAAMLTATPLSPCRMPLPFAAYVTRTPPMPPPIRFMARRFAATRVASPPIFLMLYAMPHYGATADDHYVMSSTQRLATLMRHCHRTYHHYATRLRRCLRDKAGAMMNSERHVTCLYASYYARRLKMVIVADILIIVYLYADTRYVFQIARY